MKIYTCDYAITSPDTVIDLIEHAFYGATACWGNIDDDRFEVTVFGILGEQVDELDDVMAPYLWED